jgi:hypothetical protein
MFVTIGMIIFKTFLVIAAVDVCIFVALLILRAVKLREQPAPAPKQDDFWFEQWRKGDFYDL